MLYVYYYKQRIKMTFQLQARQSQLILCIYFGKII